MNKIFILLFIVITFSNCRQITGSGHIVNETRSVESFTGISVGGGFDVEVRTGAERSVKIEADDNVIKKIEVTVKDDVLTIRTKDLNNYRDVHMQVFITAPELDMIKASASAEIVVKDQLKNSGKMRFSASSGAEITATVDCPKVETDASSGAVLKISGKTREYDASASSGADIKSADLLSEKTTAKASSGASAYVHASVELSATASSGADVKYTGGANVKSNTSSGGSVSKRD